MTDDLPVKTDLNLEASNIAPYSVSELAGALKRTLETTYDHVRLRGEISKVTCHSSGHVYLTLKDDRAAIDGVIWKGVVKSLKAQPQTGLEVIVTGKITTFPASSKYQIVIESLEMAGIGALLAQFERLKARLASEGLFEPTRKKALPYAPKIIGVITSPTGAVIRDILHRIRDRWPCRVIVWPVVVQGDQASTQVIAALKGFETAQNGLPRPDVIIIARGGGSVEDLWAFNDEALARHVAQSSVPIISAIGHETDTSLIDFVSDRRAPTPTAAAEMATPVLAELKASLLDFERRRVASFERFIAQRRERISLLARGLPKPLDLIEGAQQRLDHISHRLGGGLSQNLNLHQTAFVRTGSRFNANLLERPRILKLERLQQTTKRCHDAIVRRLDLARSRSRLPDLIVRAKLGIERGLLQKYERIKNLEQLRLSLNPDRPLELGFARVNRLGGELVTTSKGICQHEVLQLSFKDGTIKVTANDETSAPNPKPKGSNKIKPATGEQGQLF